MYSGKSTELIRRLSIYYEMDMKVLYINTKRDSRTESTFSTHNPIISNTVPFDTVKCESLDDIDISKYEVIGIDEAQLFKNLKNIVLNWTDVQNKIVIVCGLNGDFKREPFGEICDLVSKCDSITKLEPFCLSCKRKYNIINPAHFTKRLITNTETILIGGKDLYAPTCRKCYLN